jgi:1-phosphofructokinase
VGQLRDRGCRVLLDTSGLPSNTHWMRGFAHVIKPNRSELAAWTGNPAMDRDSLLATAEDLRRRGVELVVISMGEEGALFVSAQGAVCAHMTIDGVASTVGAGDAMVAGLAASLADGLGLEALARRATAFAVGKLGMMGPISRAGRGTCVGAGGFDLHADHGLTHSYWDEGRMRKLLP